MLTHCDFVFAARRKISNAFHRSGSSSGVRNELLRFRAGIGYLRARELVLLGLPFDAKRAAELGLVIAL